MNPYNNNPFATDTTRDSRSEYAANRMLRDNARAELIDRALRFIADLNAGNYLNANNVATIDMRQRARALHRALAIADRKLGA